MMQQETQGPGAIRSVRVLGGRTGVPLAVAVLVGSMALGGCDDAFQPSWVSVPDTVSLFSLSRPELNLPSAYSFRERRAYRVEGPNSTGSWDIALDTRAGALVFLPPSVLGIQSRAGIAPLTDAVFAEVDRAPSDTAAYVKADVVSAEIGRVYVVQTGATPGTFGGTCVRYAKLEPVEMDPEAGFLSFLFDANPVCNDRRLIPPD